MRERLLSFGDLDHASTYTIIVSPMPIENYVATFRCTSVTERNATLVEWQAEFDVAPEEEAEIREKVGRDTFAGGIRALAERVWFHARSPSGSAEASCIAKCGASGRQERVEVAGRRRAGALMACARAKRSLDRHRP